MISITVHHYHEDLHSLGKSTLREALIEGNKRSRMASDIAAKEATNRSKDVNNNSVPLSVAEFDVGFLMRWSMKVLGEIAFSAHMVNLLYLRTSFLSTKVHLSMDPISVISRAAIAGVNCILLGIIFHLYFGAPFDSLRKQYFSGAKNKLIKSADKND